MHLFEEAWRKAFANALTSESDAAICARLLPDDALPCAEWTRQLQRNLHGVVPREVQQNLYAACACHYDNDTLMELRDMYRRHGNIDTVMAYMQERFLRFLRDDLQLDEEAIHKLVAMEMGPAGVRHGNTILATKIPKSGLIREWMAETNSALRRRLYCHCPRVRAMTEAGFAPEETYCYCGAGFYKHIWETILERPVSVELRQSVLRGDDCCRFALVVQSD